MSPSTLNRHLTRTNQAPPSLLGPARASSLTGMYLLCPASTHGSPAHSDKRLKTSSEFLSPTVPQTGT
jgi:hypothetical protein